MFLLVAVKNLQKLSFGLPQSIIQQTLRYKSQLFNRIFSSVPSERDFLRKVIQNTEGCIIFTPSQTLESNAVQLHRDELIKELIHSAQKILHDGIIKEFTSKSNEYIIQNALPQLHKECIAQSSKWSIEENLLVMDIWKTLDEKNERSFIDESMNRYLNEVHSLPDPLALQIMYYAACGWEWKPNLYENNVTQKMIKMMQDNKTPFNHMAIYCLALFKNSPAIDNVKFIDSFLKYFLDRNLKGEEPIAVSCMLKAARKFSTRDQIHEIEKIQTKLISFVEHCDLITLTQVIQLGQKQRVHNRQLVELVLNINEKNLHKIRAKDVERCLLTIATFNFESSSRIEERFCRKALEYFKGSPYQRKKFPYVVISAISYLAVKGFYDVTLLEWALEMPNRKEFAIINPENNYLLNIDAFVKINLANSYRGPVLSNDLVSKLAEKSQHDHYINKRFLDDLKNIFDKNDLNYIVCKAMPHSNDAILVCVYNKRTNRTVKLNVLVDENKILNAADLHQNDPDLKAVAFVTTSQIFRSNKYNGFIQMKLNQMKSLGFEVIVFRKRDWNTNLNKQRFLTRQLYKSNIFFFKINK